MATCTECGSEASGKFCDDCGRPIGPVAIAELAPTTTDPAQVEEFAFLSAIDQPSRGHVFGLTHTGLVKDNNEDCILTHGVEYPEHEMSVYRVIVADGMGGPPGGEAYAGFVASEINGRLFLKLPVYEQQAKYDRWGFWRELTSSMEQHILYAVRRANRKVYAINKKMADDQRGGATLAMVIAVLDHKLGHLRWWSYNEGDARTALVTNGKFQQLSVDHVAPGGGLLRFIGAKSFITGHLVSGETWLGQNQSAAFLAYSDGLWSMLNPCKILQTVQSEQSANTACESLLGQALTVDQPAIWTPDRPILTADDNISVGAILCHAVAPLP